MTIRQRIMRFAYPLLMLKKKSREDIQLNERGAKPPVDFYSLSATKISGGDLSFSQFRNKKVLLVNVASNCGFTNQYTELEELFQRHKESLIVLGFPANDFKNQEPGSDADIVSFCSLNFGVSFPLFKKGSVIKPGQQPVYQWLSEKDQNGWNEVQPSWNFCKYLVNEEGRLEGFFSANVSPLSKEILSLIRSH